MPVRMSTSCSYLSLWGLAFSRRLVTCGRGPGCCCRCCSQSGILVAYHGLDKIEALPSFKSMEIKVHPGEKICQTVDFLTTPGSVMLVHSDPEVLARDVQFVEELQEADFYDITHQIRRLSL